MIERERLDFCVHSYSWIAVAVWTFERERKLTAQVAIIGFGAIAQEILRSSQADDGFEIRQVLVRETRVGEAKRAIAPPTQIISRLEELSPHVDFVLECAGHSAVVEYGPDVLAKGCDFGVISVGALADTKVHDSLAEATRKGQSRLSILPGAIGGIDALAAAGKALEHVSYTSRKPPKSWMGSPAEDQHDLRAMTRETTVFSGNARQAALSFPKNANVVATVALAGIGFERTEVSLVADPLASGNTHQITAHGPQFDFNFQTSGSALPANPRTSALTALSAIRALRLRSPGIQV